MVLSKTYGGFLLSQIQKTGARVFERILKESGVSAFNGAQGRILYVLWENGPQTITGISRLTSLANTSLTSMLDRMETAGLIRRTPDPANRRQILIELTPEAKALRQAYDDVSEKANEVFYDGFTEEEILLFEAQLRRILRNHERNLES